MKMDVLTKKELKYLEQELKRKANEIEQGRGRRSMVRALFVQVIQKIFADAAHKGQACSSWPRL